MEKFKSFLKRKDIEISARETAKEAKSSEEAAKRAADIANRVEKAAEVIQGKVDESRDEVATLAGVQLEPETDMESMELQAMETVEPEDDQEFVSDSENEISDAEEDTTVSSKEQKNDFVQGIVAGAPKIILEDENEENPQFYVIEPQDGGNSNERILSLHEAGMSNVAIAKELGLGVGEVKLVIDLFEGASK